MSLRHYIQEANSITRRKHDYRLRNAIIITTMAASGTRAYLVVGIWSLKLFVWMVGRNGELLDSHLFSSVDTRIWLTITARRDGWRKLKGLRPLRKHTS
jgi:hypothetical protein